MRVELGFDRVNLHRLTKGGDAKLLAAAAAAAAADE